MKLKKEYLILGAVAIALVLYLALHQTNRIHYQLPDVPQLARKQIVKLEIRRAGKSVRLNKKDNTWFVGPKNYPADENKVKRMLEIIENLTLTALVSESKNYTRYDLGEDKKIVVKAWTENRLGREFEIGKAATTARHTHVKLPGDSNVYHAQGNFKYQFEQTADDLRDLTVLSFDQNSIQKIDITENNKIISLIQQDQKKAAGKKTDLTKKPDQETKTKKIWKTSAGEEVDKPGLRRLLSMLSGLKCETYITDAKKADFKDPVYTIRLKGAQDYTLSLFTKSDQTLKRHPAVSSENAYPFYLSDRQVDDIKSTVEKMLGKKNQTGSY